MQTNSSVRTWVRIPARPPLIMGQFDGNPKPMCQGCLRRAYGIEKDGGWWCTNCKEWVVRPPKKQGSIVPSKKGKKLVLDEHGNVIGEEG
jgi:hypothetical protein